MLGFVTTGNGRTGTRVKPHAGAILAVSVALSVCGLAASATAADAVAAPTSTPQAGLHVLFIGNSYTYVNDLPLLTRRLAASVPDAPAVEVMKVTVGGATLERHWLEGDAIEVIRQGGWSHVVLQEQSTRPITDREQFFKYARLLDGEIRKSGAQTVFYLTWARQHLPETQQALTDAYMSIADELGAMVSPVGIAWALAIQGRPTLALHHEDQSHPSPSGTYVAACVFYATLLGRSPEGLPALRLSTRFGQSREGAASDISALSAADANLLQRAAWDAVQSLKRAADRLVRRSARVLRVAEIVG